MATGYVNATRRRTDNLKYSAIDATHDAQQTGFLNNASFYSSCIALFGFPPAQYDKNVVTYYTNNNFEETKNAGYLVNNVISSYSPKLKAAFFNLCNVRNGIWDTFDPKMNLGLNTKYTYSYYLDTARRRYTEKSAQLFTTTNPNPTRWDLQAIGATSIKNSFLDFSIIQRASNESPLLNISLVMKGANMFTSYIDLIDGDCSDNQTGPFIQRNVNNYQSCRYISGNNTNKHYFDTRITPQQGSLQIIGKLMGDYGHCLQCNSTDVICTWDLWLLVRCIINCLNVACKFVNGGVGENYKFFRPTATCQADLLESYPNQPSNNDIDYTIELCNLAESRYDDMDDGLSHGTMKRIEKRKSPRLNEEQTTFRTTDSDTSSRKRPNNNDDFSPEFGGGASTNQNIQTNEIYLGVLLAQLSETCSNLEQLLNTKSKLNIKNVKYEIPSKIKEYITNCVYFLKSDNLKKYLNSNIDKTLDSDAYSYKLMLWLPLTLFFKENTEDVYIPQKITKLFPYLPETMNINGTVFVNKFDSLTFYDYVIKNINANIPMETNNSIAIKKNITLDTLINNIQKYVSSTALKDEIVTMINKVVTNNDNKDNNVLIGLLCIVSNEYISNSDIVQSLFEDIIVERVDRERVFNLFTNLLLFKGLYVFNYKIIVDFVELINKLGNSNSVEYTNLIHIIEKYKTVPIVKSKLIKTNYSSPILKNVDTTTNQRAITVGGIRRYKNKKSNKNKNKNKKSNKNIQSKRKKNKKSKSKSKKNKTK